jgi:hypothetical protein
MGELASRIKAVDREADQSAVMGLVPLTPVQQWFWEGPLQNKHHYNQSVLIRMPADRTVEHIRRIMEALQTHHDALRMVFRKEGDGVIQENRQRFGSTICGKRGMSRER